MGRYKEGGNGGTGTGTVEEVTGVIGNGFQVEIGNDPTVNPDVGVKLNPTLTPNTVLQSNSGGDGIDEAAETGTGSVVKATAPTVDSPVIDTAISGTAIQDDATFASPSSTKVPTSASVKSYVDNLVAGLSWKASVRAATTVAGTLATSFENGDTIDGVVLATGDRILIKNQASATENGIYVVAASGAPTRSSDANTGLELVNATTLVNEGTVNAETQWTQSTNAPITIGVSNIVFVAINVGTYSAGNGLSQSGNTFSINTAITMDLSTAQVATNKDLSATTNTIKKVTTDTSTATPTPTGDADFNHYYLSALATNATFAAPSGTPKEGASLVIRITPDATPRTLAFNAIYRAVGVTLPTTTVASKTIYLGATYNSTASKWDVNAYALES